MKMPNRTRRMVKEKAMPQLCGSNTDPDSDTAQQFELELQWCIQQLEAALATNKMAPKQAQDAAHSLTVLRSNKAPLIKKRQVMRFSFGDYRTKMMEEEKKLHKGQNSKMKVKGKSVVHRVIQTFVNGKKSALDLANHEFEKFIAEVGQPYLQTTTSPYAVQTNLTD